MPPPCHLPPCSLPSGAKSVAPCGRVAPAHADSGAEGPRTALLSTWGCPWLTGAPAWHGLVCGWVAILHSPDGSCSCSLHKWVQGPESDLGLTLCRGLEVLKITSWRPPSLPLCRQCVVAAPLRADGIRTSSVLRGSAAWGRRPPAAGVLPLLPPRLP